MIVFTVAGRVVGTTRARTQRTIERLMDELAQKYLGQTVEAHYPDDYQPLRRAK